MRPATATARDLAPRHDWLAPSHQPWVQSTDGGVRVNVPPAWTRRTVGEHALLVSPPHGGVTIGMVPGGVANTFDAVMRRLVGSLAKHRALHRAAFQGTPLEGEVVEGVGFDGETSVEWFVARLGDAACGAVLYGIGPRGRYDANRAAVRALLHSVRPVHSGAFPRAEGHYLPGR